MNTSFKIKVDTLVQIPLVMMLTIKHKIINKI